MSAGDAGREGVPLAPKRYPFPWIPDGWFAVALARELPPGRSLEVRALDRRLLLRRSEHMLWAEAVDGDSRRMPLCSVDGVLFVWHHAAGAPPSWSVPQRLDERWSPIVTAECHVRHHVQDLAENTVDATHGVLTHGFLAPTHIHSLREEGPFWHLCWDLTLRGSYEPDVGDLRMPEPSGPGEGALADCSAPHPGQIHTTLRITACGLGIIDTLNELPGLGWPHLVRFCVTPMDDRTVRYLIVVSALAPEGTDPALIDALDRRSAEVAKRDTLQDAHILERSRYLERPALAREEASLMRVRRWARQFYSRDPRRP